MVRFQVFCLLSGTFAFMSVRKQKAAAASLFDQRKLNLQKRRSSRDPMVMPTDGVEMTLTAMTTTTTSSNWQAEEIKALMSSDHDGLDVV
jgi:hypothetical protein